MQQSIRKYMQRYGLLRLEVVGNELYLVSEDTVILKELSSYASVHRYFFENHGERAVAISSEGRGALKQELIKLGYPVDDRAGYREGESLEMALKRSENHKQSFQLRDYQMKARGFLIPI